MNNTTLEKMQWLADKGFEPDKVDVGAGMLCPYDPKEKMDKDLDAPYFTESRLWRLIRHSYDRDDVEAWLLIFDIDKTTLLEELLNLAIKAVKEGHLKAEEKE